MPDTQVLIVGAGLSGLTCAHYLHQQGVAFKLIEQGDAVGGRVRTDVVEGFRLDRGFQVLLTAYPETQRALDYDALRLGRFASGALVRYDGGFHRVSDPFRQPADLFKTVFAPVGSLGDKLKVAGLRATVRKGSLETVFEREELTTMEALRRRYGFSEAMVDRFFRPFLGGILLDADLQASSRMFEFVFRMFSEGDAALPAEGMEAIPRQLAAGLPEGSIRLNTRVTELGPGHVTLDGGQRLTADAVVVATEAPEAADLVPDVDAPGSRSVACVYYAAETPPIDDPLLVLNGDGEGPVNNFSVLTNVVPSYAPEGQALCSAVVLGNPLQPDDELEVSVRKQLIDWFGSPASAWRHLRTYRIGYALPDQSPPFLAEPERPVQVRDGLYVCGDHRRTASINGAMASGRHVAEALARDLAPAGR